MQIKIDGSCPTAYLKSNPNSSEELEAHPIFLVIDWEENTIAIENRDCQNERFPIRELHGLVTRFLLPSQVDATKLKDWIENNILSLVEKIADETVIKEGGCCILGRTSEGENLFLELIRCVTWHMDAEVHNGELQTVETWLEKYSVPEDVNHGDFITEILKKAKEKNIVLVGDIDEYILCLQRDRENGKNSYKEGS